MKWKSVRSPVGGIGGIGGFEPSPPSSLSFPVSGFADFVDHHRILERD